MGDADEFEYSVRGQLYTLEEGQLRDVVVRLKLPCADIGKFTRLDAIKLLDKVVTESSGEEDKVASLTPLADALKVVQYESLQDDVVPESSSHGNQESISNHGDSPSKLASWRKDFKVAGQIGEGKTCISFISLIRQIESGKKKGYDDSEIIEEIIKAVQPGSSLRSYLECRRDFSLPVIRSVIRAHYKEKTPTELYTELTNMTQGNKESAPDFLLRALELKEKTIFVASEDNPIQYSDTSINRMFLHSLETGLLSDSVRHEIRPTLQTKDVSDEKLIEEMNKIHLQENERISKTKTKMKVNKVDAGDKPCDHGEQIKSLKKQLAEMGELHGTKRRLDVPVRTFTEAELSVPFLNQKFRPTLLFTEI